MQEENNYFLNFSKNLRKLRKEKNLTQIEVSTLLNIPSSLYSRYESQHDVPDIKLSSLIKISNFFNITIDELIK